MEDNSDPHFPSSSQEGLTAGVLFDLQQWRKFCKLYVLKYVFILYKKKEIVKIALPPAIYFTIRFA